ncbi:MAG: tyrosine--tRNA ligase [Sphingomonadales bacterium]|nr:tyrosine--tRNA ligase [Sphingomonadales bacterium]PIX66349.1 MAG: tyrosine--tRNA ligase [Sphingomonadales bacterium CG_4_10_14_3_um_filter_58_15]NCO47962.1 tyrosine--tRNA ligase [Sphingomonadales bacterium]NCP01180.1 tyrosine--tRNA ligase [Sphingomonadales bacterium]NCP25978.1 tyrosine--tRNA ligase [Sphingomonadales bacterium]
MTQYQSDLLRLLNDRGYIHQLTDAKALDALATKSIIPGYIGFDVTADSLHVGNLVQIMLLRRLQQSGHKPIVVMGGGTTKVGDPSGKDEMRKLLDDEGIASNFAKIRDSFENFLTFGDGPTDAIMVNNDDWLGELKYIPFLRDIGRHFTINRMLAFDSVKLRLEREQPLTFLEFNYMILQAYDFLELSRQYGCQLQLGGSDQWGNIVNGIELGRRIDGAELYGVTTPLITKADGSKMGKSVDGAIWLNAARLSPYDYWQFWRNTDDRDVGKFMRLFTDIDLSEISRLESLEGSEINEAKKILADAATAMAHGQTAANDAAQTAQQTFEQGAAGGDLPVFEVSEAQISILDALVGIGFCASKGEAKRLVAGGGARIDDEPVGDAGAMIDLTDADKKISAGKKKHGLLRKV